MMKKIQDYASLKVILLLIGVYHIGLGLFTFLNKETAIFLAQTFFGMTFLANDQLLYIAKLLGIYSIAFGSIMLVAMSDPGKYRRIIDVAIFVYILRVLNRIIFAGMVQTAFQVSDMAMVVEILLLVFFGGALIFLRPKEVK